MSNHRAEAGGGGAAIPIFGPGYGHDLHLQPGGGPLLDSTSQLTQEIRLAKIDGHIWY
jgi:hypothetical protein